MRAGVLQLTRWGLLPSLVAAGTPAIRRTAFHYADGETVEVALRPTAGVEALYAPRRLLLDRILVDAAAAAGAEMRHETTVTSLLCEGDRVVGVRARDEQGRAADDQGGRHGGRGRRPLDHRGSGRCAGRVAGALRRRGALPLLRRAADHRLRVGLRRGRRRRA